MTGVGASIGTPTACPAVVVDRARAEDVARVARLHIDAINEGFLSWLGPAVLTRIFERLRRDDRGVVLVARSGADVVGFVAGSRDLPALYRTVILRDGLQIALRAGHRLVRRIPHAVETLRYAAPGVDRCPAELVAIAVDPGHRCHGTATALVRSLLAELSARGVDRVQVVTASSNAPAIRLYHRCGFAPVARIEVHKGTSSEVLSWARP